MLISDVFQCDDGELINSGWICDAVDDCSSGEDEENCGDDENSVADNSTTGW